ncbi:Galactosylgalactosylxylosylprotein 3-beta-glucuronosyltransferase sqv-8 [Taenia solium]
MAAFAVNLNLVLEHLNALLDNQVVGGQEGLILTGLGFQSAYELEPKADGCRKILVWHTKSANQEVKVDGPATIRNML